MKEKSLEAHTLVETLKHINIYIKGGQYKDLQEHMKKYNAHLVLLNRDFNVMTINSGINYNLNRPLIATAVDDGQDDISASIVELEELLIHLGIPKHKWSKYLNSKLNIYDILSYLNAELEIKGNLQMTTIIKLIDEKRSAWKKIIASILAVLAGALTALYFSPLMTGAVALFNAVITSAVGMPIIGLIFTVGMAAYNVYENHFDKKRSVFTRIRDSFFVILSSAFNIGAYAQWLAAAASITPIASILFMMAAVVDVVKELVATVQNQVMYKKITAYNSHDLNTQQERIRCDIGFIKHRRATVINTIAALVILAMVIAVNLLPGGFILSLACMIGMGVVYGAQKIALNHNESVMRDRLQNELHALEVGYEQELAVTTSTLDAHNELDTPRTDVAYESELVSDKSKNDSSSQRNQVMEVTTYTGSGLSFFSQPANVESNMDSEELTEVSSSRPKAK